MSLTHEALDVVLGRLSLHSIARLCTVSASYKLLCLQLLLKQPSNVLRFLLDQVKEAAALQLQVQLSDGRWKKGHLLSIAEKQTQCMLAVHWLLRARADGSPLVPCSLIVEYPDFLNNLFHIHNVPQAMARLLVREARICIDQQQLMAAVAQNVRGIEAWGLAVRASGCQSGLPAWSEAICCSDTAYLDTKPLPTGSMDMLELLQLAVNCKGNIAMQVLAKQTVDVWQHQVPDPVLQHLILTTVERGHDKAILTELLRIHPITASTTAAALIVELQRVCTGNYAFSSRGDICKLQYIPILLNQTAAHQLGAEVIAEVACKTARLTDWPILMLDHVCGLSSLQQISGPALHGLLSIVIKRCKSYRCDLLLELEVLHALCGLEGARQLEQQIIADLLVDAEDGAHAAVAAVLCHHWVLNRP